MIPVVVESDSRLVAIESILARHTVKRIVYVAPILLLIFTMTSGGLGAWSSALGVGVVIGNFLLAGGILAISARIGLRAYYAAAMIGFLLRLGLFTGAVLLVASLVDVDRTAFGLSAIVAYLVPLTLEAVSISKGKDRELNWL